MTRMTIADLVNDFNTKYKDNVTQQITPALARAAFQNQMDSAVPMIAHIAGSNPTGVVIPLTTTPVKIPASFFTVSLSGNPTFFEGRAASGDLLSHTNIGRLRMSFDATFTVGAGTDVAFTIAQNGVPLAFRAVMSGQGNGNPVSVSFSWTFTNILPNDTFDLRAFVLAATASMTLEGASLLGILFPQFS